MVLVIPLYPSGVGERRKAIGWGYFIWSKVVQYKLRILYMILYNAKGGAELRASDIE